MSFFIGIILPKQTIGLIDRREFNPNRRFLKFHDHRKFFQLSPQTFLLPGGSIQMGEEIFRILKSHFNGRFISIMGLLSFQKEFREQSSKIWEYIKPVYTKALEKSGSGLPTFDSLIVGPDFLAQFDDANGFLFNFHERSGNSFVCPMGPLDEMVRGRIRKFLEMAFDQTLPVQRGIAKRFFRWLVRDLALKNRFISPTHDLIFVCKDGAEVFQSRRLLFWTYKWFREKEKK